MKNKLAEITLAIIGLAIAIFLSCADNPTLEFPSEEQVRARYSSSSSEDSSSSAKSSSSSEVDSSSSAESSSSEEADSSSSSSEEVSSSSCDEADKCGGKCYNRETQFCYNNDTPYNRCGGNIYNVDLQICCGNTRYPKSSHDCCGETSYLVSGYGCRDNAVLTKCGTDLLYDPLKQFCANNGTVQTLCGGKQFDPPNENCTDGVINGVCGSELLMNHSTHFCYNQEPYPLCGGKDGKNFNPPTQFCYGNEIYDKCGDIDKYDYNPTTHYCHTDGITYSCGGKPYNPSTNYCHTDGKTYSCGNEPYDPTTHFCYNATIKEKCGDKDYNPITQFCYKPTSCDYDDPLRSCKVGNFCGINPQKYYNPDLYECKPNSNGIYLKDGIYNLDSDKIYSAVMIGEQLWLAENLKDTAPAPNGSSCDIYTLVSGSKLCDVYGRLYNYEYANTVCSFHTYGWPCHLPSDAEWTRLIDFVGGSSSAGEKLKSTSGWNSNGNGTDDYGFSALPGGWGINPQSNSINYGNEGNWWSSGNLSRYRLTNSSDAIAKTTNNSGTYFYSVRCICGPW